MSSYPLVFPPHDVSYLPSAELERAPELLDLRELTSAGWRWGGLALSAEVEARFYRLNNLPWRLQQLYVGLDEADPDEDIVEEFEEDAVALVGGHYLLDETVDAFYDAIATLPDRLLVRRAGDAGGRTAHRGREALLALKRLFQDDWRLDSVMARLERTARLQLTPRPVLVVPASATPDPTASRNASEVLGAEVTVWLDGTGAVARVSRQDARLT